MIRSLDASDMQTAEFRQLLWLAAEQPSAEIDRLINHDLPELDVRGLFDGRALVGFVATHPEEDRVTIEYVAVAEGQQRSGVGTQLINAVADAWPDSALVARTDDDAIEFYRSRGFLVADDAEDPRWPGRARYMCVRAPASVSR